MNNLHESLLRKGRTFIDNLVINDQDDKQYKRTKSLPNVDSIPNEEKTRLLYELLPPRIEEESKSYEEYEIIKEDEPLAPLDNLHLIHGLPISFSNVSEILGSHSILDKSPRSEANQPYYSGKKSPFLENDEQALLNLISEDHSDISSITYQTFRDKLQNNKDFIEKMLKITYSPLTVFNHFLSRCKILMKSDYQPMFEEEILLLVNTNNEDSPQHSINKKTKRLHFGEFTEACLNWFKSLRYPNVLRDSLKQSIRHYSEISKNPQDSEDSRFISSLLNKLKRQIKRLNASPKPNPKAQTFEESAQAGINEIFSFYSKQQFSLGISPTFEAISKNLEILTLSKFLYFCKDFRLIQSKNNSNKNGAKLSLVHDIFKKNSDFVRDMHLYQFSQSLSDIAEVYFTEEHDVQNHTNYSKLTTEKKTLKLYEILELDQPQLYTKKLSGGLSHFGNQPSRMPDDDLSKKYQLRYNNVCYLNSSLQMENHRVVKRSQAKKNNSIENTRKNNCYIRKKKFNVSSLTKLNKGSELGNSIDKKSSDEIRYKSINKGGQTNVLGNCISLKVLQRASELEKSVKQLEEKNVDKAIQLSNKTFNRSLKYAAKYNNK